MSKMKKRRRKAFVENRCGVEELNSVDMSNNNILWNDDALLLHSPKKLILRKEWTKDVFCFFESLPLDTDTNNANDVQRGIHVSPSSTIDFLRYIAPVYNAKVEYPSDQHVVGRVSLPSLPRISGSVDLADVDDWFKNEDSCLHGNPVSGQNVSW